MGRNTGMDFKQIYLNFELTWMGGVCSARGSENKLLEIY